MKSEEKKEIIEEVFRMSDADIRKTRVTSCKMEDHVWHKETPTQIKCQVCPVGLIVDDADKYVRNI